MQVLYSDGQLMQWGGQVHLANLAGRCCVVGPGYLCAVTSVAEGAKVMADLKAEGRQRGVSIEYEQGEDEEGTRSMPGTAFA